MANTNGFLGFDRFVWFQGVVEDRVDPLKLGRLRVRILGLHTENKNKIPTKELPWAFPITPITNAAMNGIGQTPMGPVEGTWVVGFFRDGENCQEPVVFGTLGGIPEKKYNAQVGFSDPTGFYPGNEYLKEPDTNRLARNEKISETVIQQRRDKLKTDVPVALEGVSENGGAREEGDDTTWSEPTPVYKTKYPFNHVTQSESGHIKEWDDTKGYTRIHEYHQLGTFYEIYEVDDGGEKKANKLTKINGENYTIVLGEDRVYISGSCNVTVDGRINIYAGGDINIEANEKATIIVKGEASVYCHNNLSITAEKNIYLSAGGDLTISAENINMTSTKNSTVNSLGGNIVLGSALAIGINSQQNVNISSELGSTIITSKISSEMSAIGSIILNAFETSVNSTNKTTVGSLNDTTIKTTNILEMVSMAAYVNVASKSRVNLEAPSVQRYFPKTIPSKIFTFNP